MAELPEVETTRRGLKPFVVGQRVVDVVVREPRLRWPVTRELVDALRGATIDALERRAKYLLLRTRRGTVIAHLGMSGSLRVLAHASPAQEHDHVDLLLGNGKLLRLRDPRRFGCLLFTRDDPHAHALLEHLGPEPLSSAFDGDVLFQKSRGRRAPVKCFLMDAEIVVGVGNIYANESLWRAGIHPRRAAGRIARPSYARLARAVKEVLAAAIEKGGTTLRDFMQSDGQPGYFHADLAVYDRTGAPCPRCRTPIARAALGGRATHWCPACQPAPGA